MFGPGSHVPRSRRQAQSRRRAAVCNDFNLPVICPVEIGGYTVSDETRRAIDGKAISTLETWTQYENYFAMFHGAAWREFTDELHSHDSLRTYPCTR